MIEKLQTIGVSDETISKIQLFLINTNLDETQKSNLVDLMVNISKQSKEVKITEN